MENAEVIVSCAVSIPTVAISALSIHLNIHDFILCVDKNYLIYNY